MIMKISQALSDSKGFFSSMRLSMFLVILSCMLLIASLSFHIVYLTIACVELNTWTEMGIFLGGIASLVTGMFWQKKNQKELE